VAKVADHGPLGEPVRAAELQWPTMLDACDAESWSSKSRFGTAEAVGTGTGRLDMGAALRGGLRALRVD
jgi:hypothetical protein